MRLGRKDYIGRYVGALPRFILGLSMFLPHLLTENLNMKAVYVVLFGFLALFAGKRIRLLYFFTFIVSVTAFHLLTPWGRVLMEIGNLTVTEGSLRTGLGKAFTLVGIVFLSLAIVRPELRLPGRLGQLLSKSLGYFEGIFEHRSEFTRKLGLQRWNVYTVLDDFLLERFNPDEKMGNMEQTQTKKAFYSSRQKNGWIPGLAATIVVLIPWALWFWTEIL